MKPLFILVGASATGKTTVCEMLTQYCGMREAISTTTRPRRASDKANAYHFLTKDQFNPEDLVEHVEYCGHSYGVSYAEVDDSDLLVAEPGGAKQVKDYCVSQGRKCVIIGLTATREERYNRMRERLDSTEDATSRVINDDTVFTNQVLLALCDYIFSTPTLFEIYAQVSGVIYKESCVE